MKICVFSLDSTSEREASISEMRGERVPNFSSKVGHFEANVNYNKLVTL